jgi:hypothetical protein
MTSAAPVASHLWLTMPRAQAVHPLEATPSLRIRG